MRHSIVLITYNNADHIVDTVQSVIEQSDSSWECIIVDNGSTDRTIEIASNLIGHDSRFQLIEKTNEGPSAGRNLGFRKSAESQYITFLDGDDKFHQDFLLVLGEYLDSNPECGLISCQFSRINNNGDDLGLGYRTRYCPSHLGFPRKMTDSEIVTPFETFFCATGQGPFAMFRKSVLEKTSLYEENFWTHEDSDIFCQMGLISEVHMIPDRLYIKREHGHNITTSGKSNYDMFRQKWDHYQIIRPEFSEKILKARRYYYRRHKPMRDFKIAAKAAKEFIGHPNTQKLQWTLQLFKSGTEGLLYGKEPR